MSRPARPWFAVWLAATVAAAGDAPSPPREAPSYSVEQAPAHLRPAVEAADAAIVAPQRRLLARPQEELQKKKHGQARKPAMVAYLAGLEPWRGLCCGGEDGRRRRRPAGSGVGRERSKDETRTFLGALGSHHFRAARVNDAAKGREALHRLQARP